MSSPDRKRGSDNSASVTPLGFITKTVEGEEPKIKRAGSHLLFPPFRLDAGNVCLWRGTKRISLRPKDFAVLHTLISHAGQLVAHTELLQAAWPDVVVSAAALKVAIGRVRRVLGTTRAGLASSKACLARVIGLLGKSSVVSIQ